MYSSVMLIFGMNGLYSSASITTLICYVSNDIDLLWPVLESYTSEVCLYVHSSSFSPLQNSREGEILSRYLIKRAKKTR